MITKIEIDGYKSFEQFSIEIEPFTAIAGVNGVGKSNLFDAIRHIGRIATLSLREAFETERGSLEDLFTAYPNGERANKISYAVELLIPPEITDQFSEKVELSYLRLRYEVVIRYTSDSKLELESEKLLIIKRNEDEFLKDHRDIRNKLPRLTGGRNPFIDTANDDKSNRIIVISQDGRAGNKRTVSAEGAYRTIMSSITTVEFPHVYAVRSLLENIHFLQLTPEKLRKSSDFRSPEQMSSDGEYLASSLQSLSKKDYKLLRRVSNDLAYVVPGVKSLIIETDEKRQEFTVAIIHTDGYKVMAKQLSDGTLRILALLLIKYDSKYNGIIILEEPENGIHPGRVPYVIDILRTMTSINDYPTVSKQIIINTHSARVLRSISDNKSIAMAYTKRKSSKIKGIYSTTDISYVEGDLLSSSSERVAFNELAILLDEVVSDGKGI